MTPARIGQTIRREGEMVLLQRSNPSPTLVADWGAMPWGFFPWAGNVAGFDTIVTPAVVRRNEPGIIVQGATQGEMTLRLSAVELARAGWQGAPRKGDRIVRKGGSLTVQACETVTLRGSDALHIVQAKG